MGRRRRSAITSARPTAGVPSADVRAVRRYPPSSALVTSGGSGEPARTAPGGAVESGAPPGYARARGAPTRAGHGFVRPAPFGVVVSRRLPWSPLWVTDMLGRAGSGETTTTAGTVSAGAGSGARRR